MRVIKRLAPMLFTAVLLVGSGAFTPAEALLASHDCSFCHDFHGNPGYSTLLIAENSELVCLSCHTVDINSTKSAAVHNPLGLASNQSGYITCRECHDAHSSRASNVKMVGYKRDAQNWSANFTAPGIRKELPLTRADLRLEAEFRAQPPKPAGDREQTTGNFRCRLDDARQLLDLARRDLQIYNRFRSHWFPDLSGFARCGG